MVKKSMKAFGIIVVLVGFTVGFTKMTAAQRAKRPTFVQGELLVKFGKKIDQPQISAVAERFDLRTLKVFKRIKVHHFKLPGNMKVMEAVELFLKSPLVEYVSPNYIRYLSQTTPNDPLFNQLWGLNNTGQQGGTSNADIDAPEAWDFQTGSSEVVVAVIDSGIDPDHPDLVPNLWTNPEEIASNGIDDDGNGYVDDVVGWDFRENDNNPTDTSALCSGHGSHVAGTIGARGNNGQGVVGVNWNVKIMPLRVFGGFLCSGNDADIIAAIEYYTEKGVRISNNSYGGGPANPAQEDAIRASYSVFVAAAGNGGFDGIGDNNDVSPEYPASYTLDNIISVAATDRNDEIAGFSNFGFTTVDLAAPGVDVLSTVPDNTYNTLSGTSMATPHVAGAAALLLADDPTYANLDIKWRLLKSRDVIPGLQVFTRGRLNVFNALLLSSEAVVDVIPLGPPTISPGTTVSYTVSVSNSSGSTKTVDRTIFARLPNGDERILHGPATLTLAPSEIISETFSDFLPNAAPLGDYRLAGRVQSAGFADFDEDVEHYTVE